MRREPIAGFNNLQNVGFPLRRSLAVESSMMNGCLRLHQTQRIRSLSSLRRLAEREAPAFQAVAIEVEMPAVAISAVEADLEVVAAHERRQAIASPDAQTFQRNGLVQELHAGFLAERAAMTNRIFARVERIHPRPYGRSDNKQ